MAMMYIDDGFIMGLILQLCWQAVQCFLNIFAVLGFLTLTQ